MTATRAQQLDALRAVLEADFEYSDGAITDDAYAAVADEAYAVLGTDFMVCLSAEVMVCRMSPEDEAHIASDPDKLRGFFSRVTREVNARW
jgi:hypothetical protein